MEGLLLSRAGVADFNDDLARNVVSLRVSEDLFDDLSDDPADQQIAIEHEMATKPPPYTSDQPAVQRPFEEAEWQNAIGYPFENWSESRYSTGRFGVWYGAESIETTVHETVYHWRRFLADAGWDAEGVIERRVYWVHCSSLLLDFRPLVDEHAGLVHPRDYTLTQQLGARLHREGHPGVVSRSARCAGEIFDVFNPNVLSDPRTACFLTYQLRGGTVTVERDPGVTWLEV